MKLFSFFSLVSEKPGKKKPRLPTPEAICCHRCHVFSSAADPNTFREALSASLHLFLYSSSVENETKKNFKKLIQRKREKKKK